MKVKAGGKIRFNQIRLSKNIFCYSVVHETEKAFTVDIISVECAEGEYRSTSMTKCESCSLGKEPNADKDDCGKQTWIGSDSI